MLFEDEYGDIMTVDDLMKYLNIGRTTAYKLLQSGKIKVLRFGRIYRLSKASVQEFVKKESR
ncbi:MAG: helix-turn-helix domain-containing protein [Schwartzia succinivorans]|nr:helix-turn-helix domain-containing protein [Schwartzia succinivorans]